MYVIQFTDTDGEQLTFEAETIGQVIQQAVDGEHFSDLCPEFKWALIEAIGVATGQLLHQGVGSSSFEVPEQYFSVNLTIRESHERP